MASAGDTLQPSQSVRCGSVARLDSDRSAEAEAFSEKSTVEVPPALPQRTYTGSVRDQFASALQAHFASCSDPETGAYLFSIPFTCIYFYIDSMHSSKSPISPNFR